VDLCSLHKDNVGREWTGGSISGDKDTKLWHQRWRTVPHGRQRHLASKLKKFLGSNTGERSAGERSSKQWLGNECVRITEDKTGNKKNESSRRTAGGKRMGTTEHNSFTANHRRSRGRGSK